MAHDSFASMNSSHLKPKPESRFIYLNALVLLTALILSAMVWAWFSCVMPAGDAATVSLSK